MTSRQAELIGWAMSACSVARPSAPRVARPSSRRPPHWLQWRARRWFLEPQPGQRSVSLRLGMATNEPLVPSMILRSRMTKQSSNVTEQKACKRSLLSSMSLIRTSVMTTVVLLFGCGTSIGVRAARPGGWPIILAKLLHTAAHRKHAIDSARPLGIVAQGRGDSLSFFMGAGQGKQGAAAAAHKLAGRDQRSESLVVFVQP